MTLTDEAIYNDCNNKIDYFSNFLFFVDLELFYIKVSKCFNNNYKKLLFLQIYF